MSEVLTTPIFQQFSPEFERTDPWSGPQGFLVGGIAVQSDQEMSEEFFEAANLLIEAIQNGEMEDYKLANPVLFLYRHALELSMKAIIGGPRVFTHDLGELADKMQASLKADNIEVPNWIMDRLKEVAAIDRTSTAFRYGITPNGPVDGELYVSVPQLKKVMIALHKCLSLVAWEGRFPHKILVEDSEADLRIMDGTIPLRLRQR